MLVSKLAVDQLSCASPGSLTFDFPVGAFAEGASDTIVADFEVIERHCAIGM